MAFDNFTSFDYNASYIGGHPAGIFTPRRTFVEVLKEVISLCGVAINVVIISLLVFGVIRSSKQRRSPCLWLLLGVMCANFLTLVWDLLLWLPFGGHGNVAQDVMTSNRVACILMLHLHVGFDTASVLGSFLLVCHIFLRIYEPKSTNGQRTFRFWLQAEAAIWTASIAFAIGMRAPDTHIVTYEHENPVRQYCTVYYRKDINEVFSLLFFLIPLMHALPMALLSLRLNAGNRRESQTEVELQPFPVTSQPAVASVEDESGKQEEECLQNERQDNIMAAEDGNRGSAILPWVIFIILNTFLGLGLRIPYHLQQQDFFRRRMFNAGFDITDQLVFINASQLCHFVYHSVAVSICLVLPEIRCTLRSIFKLCKK